MSHGEAIRHQRTPFVLPARLRDPLLKTLTSRNDPRYVTLPPHPCRNAPRAIGIPVSQALIGARPGYGRAQVFLSIRTINSHRLHGFLLVEFIHSTRNLHLFNWYTLRVQRVAGVKSILEPSASAMSSQEPKNPGRTSVNSQEPSSSTERPSRKRPQVYSTAAFGLDFLANISEASDILAPLKAACKATKSILDVVQVSRRDWHDVLRLMDLTGRGRQPGRMERPNTASGRIHVRSREPNRLVRKVSSRREGRRRGIQPTAY